VTVSMRDVADRAGVSPTTVSHTLSGRRVVSPEIQARVRAAMDDLGYTPRRTAQNLANGRTRLIGLMVPDITNSYFAELAKAVERSAVDANYNLVLCNSGFNFTRELLYLEMIKSRAVDGVIYAAGAPPADSELARLLGSLPLVLVDEEIPGSAAPAFLSDNKEGGRLAASLLVELGHRRTAIVSTPNLQSSALRASGFLEGLMHAGLPAPTVVGGDFTFEGGVLGAERILDKVHTGAVTAVFATNDLMALGVVRRLEESGLRVPEDISVVGFDDIAAASISNPRLTTIRQNPAELGRLAAAALIDSLESREPLSPGQQLLDVSLIERDSSGPPPARTRE